MNILGYILVSIMFLIACFLVGYAMVVDKKFMSDKKSNDYDASL